MATHIPSKSTTPLALAAEKTPLVKHPVHGGVHNFAADHSSRPVGHELDHSLRPAHEADHHDHALGAPSHHGALGHHGRGPLMRGGDRPSLADDSNLTKQILNTHAPDIEELDVRPVLAIVEDIMRLAKPSSPEVSHVSSATTLGVPTPTTHLEKSTHSDKLDHDKALALRSTPYHHEAEHHLGFHTADHDAEIIKILAYPINRISCEIICKSSAGGESHAITMDLLRALSNYSWDAKAVITFSAFAINYGEFWLVEQLHTKNPLAKNIATLKDLPDTMVHAAELKKKFESVLDLLNAVLRVTHCSIEFKELPQMYITREAPELKEAAAHIPTAVYWIIRSLLVCASTLLNLIGSGHE